MKLPLSSVRDVVKRCEKSSTAYFEPLTIGLIAGGLMFFSRLQASAANAIYGGNVGGLANLHRNIFRDISRWQL